MPEPIILRFKNQLNKVQEWENMTDTIAKTIRIGLYVTHENSAMMGIVVDGMMSSPFVVTVDQARFIRDSIDVALGESITRIEHPIVQENEAIGNSGQMTIRNEPERL